MIIFLVSIGFLANSVDPDQKLADQDPTVYHAAYVILHGLVDMIMMFSHSKNNK